MLAGTGKVQKIFGVTHAIKILIERDILYKFTALTHASLFNSRVLFLDLQVGGRANVPQYRTSEHRKMPL